MIEMIRTYYNIDDILGHEINTTQWFKEDGTNMPNFKKWYESVAKLNNYSDSIFGKASDANKSKLDIALRKLITYWHTHEIYLAYTDDNEELDTTKIGMKVLDIFSRTMESYFQVIDRYNNMLENATEALTSTSTTTFNDTPTADGDYSAEKYSTNISKNKIEQQVDPVARYQQLTTLITNIYQAWINEFECLEIRG